MEILLKIEAPDLGAFHLYSFVLVVVLKTDNIYIT